MVILFGELVMNKINKHLAPESCSARRRAPRRVCVLPEEFAILTGSPGALFAPESCGARRRARRRVCTPGGACNTYWEPGGLCSLRRAVAPGGVPGGVCVLPEELVVLTGSPGALYALGDCGWPGGRCGLRDLGIPLQ